MENINIQRIKVIFESCIIEHLYTKYYEDTSSDFNSAILFLTEDVRDGAFREEPPEMEFKREVLCDESTFFRY